MPWNFRRLLGNATNTHREPAPEPTPAWRAASTETYKNHLDTIARIGPKFIAERANPAQRQALIDAMSELPVLYHRGYNNHTAFNYSAVYNHASLPNAALVAYDLRNHVNSEVRNAALRALDSLCYGFDRATSAVYARDGPEAARQITVFTSGANHSRVFDGLRTEVQAEIAARSAQKQA